jgi:phosphatidylserine synthase
MKRGKSFNTQVGTTSGDYFVGLPIPAAAGVNEVFPFGY